ncbi:MAG: ThiF family adenylyltransferase, partial [Candidatus Gastranaerophilales bacterium]|nr:ThiF family adenylyltransferase [Candidatus Gastranaerophilales bacterium]
MSEKFSRTELLIGQKAIEKLSKSRVAVFGVGGVGGYVVEALVRSGVGELDLIDNDIVAESNINRQIIATSKTVGMSKVEAAKNRILDINPDIKVNVHQVFYTPETAGMFNFAEYDYVVDAIDTVVGKLQLIEEAKINNIPVICAMGAG